jgi:MFS transporter, ACS family, hexuronate transporter
VDDRRWRIALLIAAAIAISYFDRQTLPVAIKAIQHEIPVTNFQFGQLNLAFLIAYGIMYAAGGKLIDVLGTRKGFFFIMVWWSLACASHGLAAGFGMLAASRLMLGMGEGGGFPAATKAVAEFFPATERASAMGLINAGTAVGAVIAPPGIALVIRALGWRWVFFISGAIGLAWSAWWHRSMPDTPAEPRAIKTTTDSIPWIELLHNRQVCGLVAAKFLSDAAWFVYISWLAKYLYDVRGFDTAHVGYFAWIPFAASGIGSLAGGWLSSQLIRSGRSIDFSRKVALGLSAACMPWIFFVTLVPVEWSIVLFSLAFFGQQSWSGLVMTVPTDIFPRAAVGSVAGLVGMGGAFGGAIFNLVVGYMLDHKMGYGTVFGMLSTFHVAAFVIILLIVGRIRPLETS